MIKNLSSLILILFLSGCSGLEFVILLILDDRPQAVALQSQGKSVEGIRTFIKIEDTNPAWWEGEGENVPPPG